MPSLCPHADASSHRDRSHPQLQTFLAAILAFGLIAGCNGGDDGMTINTKPVDNCFT
jgi:hypothetical protein